MCSEATRCAFLPRAWAVFAERRRSRRMRRGPMGSNDPDSRWTPACRKATIPKASSSSIRGTPRRPWTCARRAGLRGSHRGRHRHLVHPAARPSKAEAQVAAAAKPEVHLAGRSVGPRASGGEAARGVPRRLPALFLLARRDGVAPRRHDGGSPPSGCRRGRCCACCWSCCWSCRCFHPNQSCRCSHSSESPPTAKQHGAPVEVEQLESEILRQ